MTIAGLIGLLAVFGIVMLLGQSDTGSESIGNGKQDSSIPSEHAYGWEPLPEESVLWLKKVGFRYADEWRIDSNQPRHLQLFVCKVHKEKIGYDGVVESVRGDTVPEVFTVSKELADLFVRGRRVKRDHTHLLWPLFVRLQRERFEVFERTITRSFMWSWWDRDGVPDYVGRWYLENERTRTGDYETWFVIYKSGIPIPEAWLRDAAVREVDEFTRNAKLAPKESGVARLAWFARICRKQYPEGTWWRDNPDIQYALAIQDKHDGGS